jgi:ABC-type uncharacterized transport system fused permease/ATPase subunit
LLAPEYGWSAVHLDPVMPSDATNAGSEEIISFRGVNIVTPSQKLLASQLSCDVSQGKSLLVTGNIMLQRLSGLNLPAPC